MSGANKQKSAAKSGLQDVCGNTRTSWQGDPLARPRCIPPANDAVSGVEPDRVRRPYRRSITRWSWSLPAPPAPNHGGTFCPFHRHPGRASKLPGTPWSPVLPVNHAREISLSLHPSPKRRFVAPWHPRAGLGAFPLHRHRTMEKRLDVSSPFKARPENPPGVAGHSAFQIS